MDEIEQEYERYYKVKLPASSSEERDTAFNLALKRHQTKTQAEYSSQSRQDVLSIPLSFERQIAPLISAIEKSEGIETQRTTPAEKIELTFTTTAHQTRLKYEVSYVSQAKSVEEQAIEKLMSDPKFIERVSQLVADALPSDNSDTEMNPHPSDEASEDDLKKA